MKEKKEKQTHKKRVLELKKPVVEESLKETEKEERNLNDNRELSKKKAKKSKKLSKKEKRGKKAKKAHKLAKTNSPTPVVTQESISAPQPQRKLGKNELPAKRVSKKTFERKERKLREIPSMNEYYNEQLSKYGAI